MKLDTTDKTPCWEVEGVTDEATFKDAYWPPCRSAYWATSDPTEEVTRDAVVEFMKAQS